MNEFNLAETETFLKQKESPDLKPYYDRILARVYPVLRENPHYGPNIRRLKGQLKGIYRYRVGSYRLFYMIDDAKKTVYLLDFSHRQSAYKQV